MYIFGRHVQPDVHIETELYDHTVAPWKAFTSLWQAAHSETLNFYKSFGILRNTFVTMAGATPNPAAVRRSGRGPEGVLNCHPRYRSALSLLEHATHNIMFLQP